MGGTVARGHPPRHKFRPPAAMARPPQGFRGRSMARDWESHMWRLRKGANLARRGRRGAHEPWLGRGLVDLGNRGTGTEIGLCVCGRDARLCRGGGANRHAGASLNGQVSKRRHLYRSASLTRTSTLRLARLDNTPRAPCAAVRRNARSADSGERPSRAVLCLPPAPSASVAAAADPLSLKSGEAADQVFARRAATSGRG